MKKYLPYILIGAMIMMGLFFFLIPTPQEKAEGAIFIPILAGIALWQLIGHSIGVPTPLDLTLDIAKTTIMGALSIIGWFFFHIASILVSISGYLLDVAVEHAITLNTFIKSITTSDGANAISAGWATSRNVANLFFIFILLYIAIATILQLSSYGMKDLLVRVIIIALLVNFSLMITKVVVDASNILALEFYNKMSVETKASESGTSNGVSFNKGDTIKAVSPSMVFVNALKLQTIYKTDEGGASIFLKSVGKNEEKIALILWLGTIVLVVVAFVFFAMAVLFVIRTVLLILLMVLAPLAFLAMALPKTQQYAKKWWDTLFNQAFFAPACLFLLYLSASIVSSPGFVNIIDNTGAASLAGALSGDASNNNYGIIFSYILVIVLLIASLIIAKQMGAWGAGTVMKWGQSAKKWGQGYAGRVGKRYVGRAATAAEGALEKERESKIGRGFAKTLKAVPFLQRGLAGVAQLKKKEVGKYEKQYAGYDAGTLEQLKGKVGTTPEAREAMGKLITKKRAQEAKKEDISKENVRYEKIEKELPKMEELNKADKTRKIELNVELEENSIAMQKKDISEAEKDVLKKKRYQILLEQEQVEERIKDVNQMREEKKKIEENRARRREIEGLEEGIAEAKAMAGEKKKEEKKKEEKKI